MPWTYTYEVTLSASVVVASGELTPADLNASFRQALLDPQFGPHSRILYDYRHIAETGASIKNVLTFRYHQYFSPTARRALLLSGAHFREFENLRPHHPVSGQLRAFTERDDALDWLHDGVPPWKRPI